MGRELKTLRSYKEYGEALIEFHQSVLENPPPYNEPWVPEELKKGLNLIKKLADDTIKRASSPVKIGIMGEFDAGKTLLIGSLIGYADALPVSSTPTTGNVTAIHLVQQPELKTTKVSDFRIHYLSHQEAKECLTKMLDEAEKRFNRLPPEQLDGLKNLKASNTIDIQGILSWCENAWNLTTSLEKRSILREIVVFSRAYHIYENDLCGRNNVKVELATAKEVLELPSSLAGILEISFQELAQNPSRWQNLAQPSPEDLRNSFPLIRIIDVTVEVSKEIWDLSSLRGTNELVLLDFPGLGAGNSSVRDTILSLQAMKDVQTILLLLDARKSGTETGARIRRMLEEERGEDLKDRIIIGVGRFNQLELSGKDSNNINNFLTEVSEEETSFFEPSPSLSEDKILEKLKPLRDTLANANQLTIKKENIILLSQLHGLTKLAEQHSLIQVCSPEFLSELGKPNEPEEFQKRQKWQELSEKLLGPSLLSEQLSSFAHDGGISRLRTLLNQHVVEHGMKQILDDVLNKSVKPLEQEQVKLENILENLPDYIPMEENPNFLSLRAEIEKLLSIYRQFQEDLNRQPILKNRNGMAVNDLVKNQLNHRIFFEWSEWSLLLENTKDGIISVTKSSSFWEEEEDDDEVPPIKSDDFYPEFDLTIKDMQVFAHDCTREAVIELFSKLSGDLKQCRNHLNEIILPEMEQDINQRFGKKEVRFLKSISRAIDPINEWQDIIIKRSQLVEIDKPLDAEQLFPLALKDQIFDWSPDKKFPVTPRPFNHQITVLRLRDEITTSTEGHLLEYVSQLTKEVKSNFSLALNDIIRNLQELLRLKHEPLLRYVASGEERSQIKNPRWLETLSQISVISCPK